MRLLNINGRLVSKNIDKYRIKWDGPCRSDIQFNVKRFLYPFWRNFLCYEEFPVFGTKLKVDIINLSKKIAIEVQGPQHTNFNKFFHNNSRVNYLNSMKRDHKKLEWLELNSFKLIEIVKEDMDKLSPEYLFDLFKINIV